MTNTESKEKVFKTTLTRDYEENLKTEVTVEIDHAKQEIIFRVKADHGRNVLQDTEIVVFFSGNMGTISTNGNVENILDGVEVKGLNGRHMLTESSVIMLKSLD